MRNTLMVLLVGLSVPSAPPGSRSGAADPGSRARGLPPLVAALSVDATYGDFPRRVVFDAAGSELGAGQVTYEWSFGDGAITHDGPSTVHTYLGAGSYPASLTLVDESGRRSTAAVRIEVSEPDCPHDDPPLTIGEVDDHRLDSISGIAASRIEPTAYWVHGDIEEDRISAVDLFGHTLSTHDLPGPMVDFEDIDAVNDPVTGAPLLFLGDIGDNDAERAEIAVWMLPEPDPFTDGAVAPEVMRLTYPSGAVNAETMLVDPLTLDVFVLTKDQRRGSEVFVKRAPHQPGGPYVLESLGRFDSIDTTLTGGDVSPDGLRVVVRGYSETARLWVRDGRRPLESVFSEDPCEIDLADDGQGEAITFSIDGRGLVTTSEGESEPIWYIGF